MKKIFTLAALVLFTLTSCSGDDNQNTVNTEPGTTPVTGSTDESAFLLKKMIETDQAGEAITSIFTYDGNKIVSIASSDNTKEMYYYTNDKITKIEFFEGNYLAERRLLEYDNLGKISIHKYYVYELDWGSTYVYTHNGNGTINVKHYVGDVEQQTQLNDEGTITLTNGNVTSYVNGNTNYTYTFDTKNSPLRNVIGNDVMTIIYEEGGINNILSDSGVTNGVPDATLTSTYTYNTANFPTACTEVYGNETYNLEYFYE